MCRTVKRLVVWKLEGNYRDSRADWVDQPYGQKQLDKNFGSTLFYRNTLICLTFLMYGLFCDASLFPEICEALVPAIPRAGLSFSSQFRPSAFTLPFPFQEKQI